MIDEHYIGLLAGYALAVIGWWAIFALRGRIGLFPERWAQRRDFRFKRPWAELGFALLGAVGVIVVGRLSGCKAGCCPRQSPSGRWWNRSTNS